MSLPAKIKPLYDKLNVGCGGDYREGFVNIDGNQLLSKVDYIVNITPGVLPKYFVEGSFRYIRAKDFLEHHFHWEGCALLKDFYALLAEDGQLDMTLPDVANIINSTKHDVERKILWLYGGQDIQPNPERQDISRQRNPQYYCHKYGWTVETLVAELYSAGFSDVEVDAGGWNMRIVARKKCNVSKQDSELRMSGCVV